jgi:hypothetical protein
MTTNTPRYFISSDSLKTIAQGALGAMTFGAYHQYTTNCIMELNNKQIQMKHQTDLDSIKNEHKNDILVYKKELEFNKKQLESNQQKLEVNQQNLIDLRNEFLEFKKNSKRWW